METGKSNKMVTPATKDAKQKGELQEYYFPSLGMTILAADIHEAQRKADAAKRAQSREKN